MDPNSSFETEPRPAISNPTDNSNIIECSLPFDKSDPSPILEPQLTEKVEVFDVVPERVVSDRDWSGPFTFVVGSDPQFGMIGTCKLKKVTCTWQPEVELTRETIRRVNAMSPKPKFFLLCGDMLDALPFPKTEIQHYIHNDIDIRDQQYADFVKIFQEELDPEIKLLFACGNHDVGDFPTAETLSKYRKEFGPDYFTFWVGGVKFVVLNSQFFHSPSSVPEETNKHLQWIEENVADARAKFIVVFQHIPFFTNHSEEDTIYSNIPKEQRLVILEKLWSAGVRYVFCGHLHKNAGGMYKDLEQVVTGPIGAPFGDDPSGFRVVQVGESGITHEYVTIRETTDCSEFEIEKEDAKEETKSVTTSEKVRRSKWLWACCGASSAVINEENNNIEEATSPSL